MEDVGVGAESLRPELMAQHDDFGAAVPVFARRKRATHEGKHADDGEVVSRNLADVDHQRIASAREIESVWLDQRERLERSGAFFKRLVFVTGNRQVSAA